MCEKIFVQFANQFNWGTNGYGNKQRQQSKLQVALVTIIFNDEWLYTNIVAILIYKLDCLYDCTRNMWISLWMGQETFVVWIELFWPQCPGWAVEFWVVHFA